MILADCIAFSNSFINAKGVCRSYEVHSSLKMIPLKSSLVLPFAFCLLPFALKVPDFYSWQLDWLDQ
ncbi:hypothetical protein BJP34_01295 [Moorena producens PAL-8-15-08-1]|uniref:Uncharacterized protein n=1 Tax=Moorena producens PAL-8-15-08-1 TaxID=1458985 RepID=A0A1D8TKZ7_9CYAN|nr:hypothetical protein [Moorena producens]AOW98256.1 hypothetical protein BJP34_01295 [Moorena producens PAL-8-15-08-1]